RDVRAIWRRRRPNHRPLDCCRDLAGAARHQQAPLLGRRGAGAARARQYGSQAHRSNSIEENRNGPAANGEALKFLGHSKFTQPRGYLPNRNRKVTQMHVDQLYPSRFLRCSDLGGKPLVVTIANLTREDVGGESKVIMSFTNGEKSLILNKVNARSVAKLH